MTDREQGLAEQGRRLREWRLAQAKKTGKHLTQLEAADRIGASQGAWAAWETGRKAPDSFFAGELERLTAGRHVVRAKGWAFRRGVRRDAPTTSSSVA